MFAQTSTVSSGNTVNNSQGSVSYTVGQIAYTSSTSSSGNIEQGVQHSYSISETLGTQESSTALKIVAFPNPTTNTLQLKLENNNTDLSYKLINLLGETISTEKITSNSITINMELQPSTTYFLNIYKQSNLLKTFKIIKN
ncbi:MAG: T9SS type A sorting domain-containing protein [Flavobacteriaceae bacterium]|nr:T9SS type A sorting domain-containing protein [Flavobacteriaceae bacterium]